jgi:hypothetical protein
MRYETGHLNKAPNEKQLGRGKKKKKMEYLQKHSKTKPGRVSVYSSPLPVYHPPSVGRFITPKTRIKGR